MTAWHGMAESRVFGGTLYYLHTTFLLFFLQVLVVGVEERDEETRNGVCVKSSYELYTPSSLRSRKDEYIVDLTGLL